MSTFNPIFEDIVLASCMTSDKALSNAVSSLSDRYYLRSVSRSLWVVIRDLWKDGVNVDITSVCSRISNNDILDYAYNLVDKSSSENIAYYIAGLKENWKRRQSEIIGNKFIACSNAEDFQEQYDDAESDVHSLNTDSDNSRPECVTSILPDVFDELELRQQGKMSGIITGFTCVDQMLQGLKPQQLIVVGGRPSMGKTTFALNIACNCSKKVLFMSLETSKIEATKDMISMISGVNYRCIENGTAPKSDYSKMTTNLQKLGNIWVDDTPAPTLSQVRSKVMQVNPDLLIIDYLTLMTLENGENHVLRVGKTCSGIKSHIAKALNIPVILISQLSRDLEKRNDKRPALSDLRESGQVEQDADVVIFPYRHCEYDRGHDKTDVELIVAKNKKGKKGIIKDKIKFYGDIMRFENV